MQNTRACVKLKVKHEDSRPGERRRRVGCLGRWQNYRQLAPLEPGNGSRGGTRPTLAPPFRNRRRARSALPYLSRWTRGGTRVWRAYGVLPYHGFREINFGPQTKTTCQIRLLRTRRGSHHHGMVMLATNFGCCRASNASCRTQPDLKVLSILSTIFCSAWCIPKS